MARKLALLLVMILLPGGLIALAAAWLAHRFGLPARWKAMRELASRRHRRLRAPAVA